MLLGATAAMMLAALVLSMNNNQTGDSGQADRSQSDLIRENQRLEAELMRMRMSQAAAAPVAPAPVYTPTVPVVPDEEALAAEIERNMQLEEELRLKEIEAKMAQDEAMEIARHDLEKRNRDARRARDINMAMLMAQVVEWTDEEGIQFAIIDVKMPDLVNEGMTLGIRRNGGIVGRLQVSRISFEGNFADPLPASFPGGVDVKVGDELIVVPD